MPITFDQVWEKSEQLHQASIQTEEVSNIIEELILKVNLYTLVDQKSAQLDTKEQATIKSRAMGEILLTLTKLSLKDNINVYEALAEAAKYRSIDVFAAKHSTT